MRRPRLDLAYRFGRLLSKIFLPTFGSIEVVGREKMPASGPLLIAVNHQTYSDPAVLIYAFDRPVWWMAKRSLFKGTLISCVLRQVHVFPIDRDRMDLAALAQAKEFLDQGRALVLFPEGTRHPGALGPGRDGLAYLALRTGVPVLPVAVTGTDRIPHVLRTPFHFQRLRVAIGEPLTFPSTARIDRAVLQATTDRIMRSIAALLPPTYRGVYAAESDGSVESLPKDEAS
jgi:1-acyl-sn-glycerol-3-phosphate acyltransferase